MANSCFLKVVTRLCHNTNLHCSFRFASKSPLGHTPNLLIRTWQCNKLQVICSEVYMGWNTEQHYRPISDVHLCHSSNACHPIPSHNSLCISRKNRLFFFFLPFLYEFRVKISSVVMIKPKRFSPSIPEAVHEWWPWQHGHQDMRYFTVVLLLVQLTTSSWNTVLQWGQMPRAKDPSVVCVGVTSVTVYSWKQMEQFILQYSCIFSLYLNED